MKIKKNQRLSDYTTTGIGGPVPVVYLPENEQELSDLLRTLKAEKRKFRIIGNGSNILADDGSYDGALVCTKSMQRIFEVDGESVTVDAGYPAAQLAYQTASKGLTGLEFAIGIPGSIGGLVRMNAGAHQHSISEVVDSVNIVQTDGHIVVANHENLQFTYRSSAIPLEAVITKVRLRLKKGDPKKIHEIIRNFNEQRTSSQPLRERSAGCFFRNPGVAPAGKLIEDSGLKGFKMGGAMVSDVHANFIVNRQNATFEDVVKLIDHIKRVVKEKQGIDLQEEVVVWRSH